jgi:hypothetical protein
MLTVAQIRAKAGADAEAMKSVCLSAHGQLHGTGTELASITAASLLAKAPGPGVCEVMATTPGGASITALTIGKGIWVRANHAYARIAGTQTTEALSARADKWIHVPDEDATVRDLLSWCHVTWLTISDLTFPDQNPKWPETRVAGLPVIDGQRTVGITDPDHDITYISDTARPLPVRDAIGNTPDMMVDFFDFGIPVTSTPPPSAAVIDGTKHGS